MVLAIQQAYYLQARNPSDHETLIELAGEIGADPQRFADDLVSKVIDAELYNEIRAGQAMGAAGFPSLILEKSGHYQTLRYSYTDAEWVLSQLNSA